MSIRFAGIPLLLEDKGGKIQRWLDAWLPIADLCLTSPTIALDADDEWIPLPRYPELPPPRLNTFIMPTGATRWGYGLFLVDEGRLARIRSVVNQSKLAVGELEITSSIDNDPRGIRGGIKLKVHALPARKISFLNLEEGAPQWILPLVDNRFFWQFGSVKSTESQPAPSNKALYGFLSNCADSLSPMFAKADLFYHADKITDKSSSSGDATNQIQIVLAHGVGNTAALIESAVQSAGQHLVPYWPTVGVSVNNVFSGQFNVVGIDLDTGNPSSANAKWANNRYSSRLTTGPNGQSFFLESGQPFEVKVRFPRWKNGIVRDDDHYESIQKKTANVTNMTRIVYCNALACDEAGAGRNNIAQMDVLAANIADAIFSRKYAYDLTFTGIVELAHTAIDDYVEWTQRIVNGEYACHTRVQSLPMNFGLQRYCKFAPRDVSGVPQSGPSRLGDTIYGTMAAALTALGSADLTVTKCDGSIAVLGWPAFDSADTVYQKITVKEVHNWSGIVSGMRATAERVQREWIAIAVQCP